MTDPLAKFKRDDFVCSNFQFVHREGSWRMDEVAMKVGVERRGGRGGGRLNGFGFPICFFLSAFQRALLGPFPLALEKQAELLPQGSGLLAGLEVREKKDPCRMQWSSQHRFPCCFFFNSGQVRLHNGHRALRPYLCIHPCITLPSKRDRVP